MSTQRERAIAAAAAYPVPESSVMRPVADICGEYASDVFGIDQMQKALPQQCFRKLLKTIRNREALDPSIADDVANAMKDWAISKGATHYTHWFQPLTGSTAEKHDSFFEPDADAHVILKFSGKNLCGGEADASSFPSGGLRSTFEARGYTAWDATSPAFIRRGRNGATLCIPTAFCSYTGLALDRKTPLLRTIQVITKSVQRLMKAFKADQPNAHVSINLGAEQEYFLIDRNFYYARPDLIQTGRTLFGAPPPKHQQLDDHYYGTIRPRILAFMTNVDQELWRLGIPAKTRHNEAAPAQFEIAPLFENLNLAVDHNMLIMEILKQTAEKHGLVCLLHEKPFAGINGSGKHNNWSLCYGSTNLLNPGNDPCQNAIFLTVLCAIIRAVDLHSDLLRVATASCGNDHRLGANEAPPAIISIFLGEQLTDVLEQIEKGSVKETRMGGLLKIGVETLPPLPQDATDRNRTSPFAFTGNKFEFRAPGSSHSCAGVSVVLNTIVAESLDAISAELETFPAKSFHAKLQKLLQTLIHKHKRVIFNGNGYDRSWVTEAKRRGLPNLKNTPEAMDAFRKEENIQLFEKLGVFSRMEVLSRYEIFMEEYKCKVRIEAKLALLMARTVIMPVIVRELNLLYTAVNSAAAAGANVSSIRKNADRIAELLDDMQKKEDVLEAGLGKENGEVNLVEQMKDLRKTVDMLELSVSDREWPLPKYREMLFIY